ncbi:MAG TPA: hypothetical protein VHY48_09450 [Acidobacteriaceae bacterium]|jgi:hypothetical protein|nr:hypothetical protein [Acidobacteriaceae bacterium]
MSLWWVRGALLAAALITLAAFDGAHAMAQASPTATGPGSSVVIGGGAATFQSIYGSRDLGGGFVFADLQPHWRIGIEAEARYLRLHTSEDVTEKNYLAGPRVLVRSGRWQPYAKFLVGDGHINMPFHYGSGDFLALVPGGGVDFALNSFVNIRVADFEYQLWREFPYGTMHPYGISAGVSIRLTPILRFPKGPRVRH